jgi:hypothetical protein
MLLVELVTSVLPVHRSCTVFTDGDLSLHYMLRCYSGTQISEL